MQEDISVALAGPEDKVASWNGLCWTFQLSDILCGDSRKPSACRLIDCVWKKAKKRLRLLSDLSKEEAYLYHVRPGDARKLLIEDDEELQRELACVGSSTLDLHYHIETLPIYVNIATWCGSSVMSCKNALVYACFKEEETATTPNVQTLNPDVVQENSNLRSVTTAIIDELMSGSFWNPVDFDFETGCILIPLQPKERILKNRSLEEIVGLLRSVKTGPLSKTFQDAFTGCLRARKDGSPWPTIIFDGFREMIVESDGTAEVRLPQKCCYYQVTNAMLYSTIIDLNPKLPLQFRSSVPEHTLLASSIFFALSLSFLPSSFISFLSIIAFLPFFLPSFLPSSCLSSFTNTAMAMVLMLTMMVVVMLDNHRSRHY
jgi:hypothetical protein